MPKKPPMSATNRNLSAKRQRTALSSQRNEYNHPMGKLNVSSVHAPSDMQSLIASPEQSKKKILDERVFGSAGGMNKVRSQVGIKRKNSRLDNFLSEAEQTEEVNEMLIDAIKAKLAILDTMDD